MFVKIKGYEYSINEMGQVKNDKTGRIPKAHVSSHGYLHVNLSSNGKNKIHAIHRLLGICFLNCPPHMHVDHIDGNRLNNDLTNLRVVTPQQNQWNAHKAKGYCWKKASNKWVAQIGVNGKRKFLGLYDTKEDARAAYLAAKAIYHLIP